MALLVPFLIVAVVWSVASVFLFQTPPAQTFVTHQNLHVVPDLGQLGAVGFSFSEGNERLASNTVSQQAAGANLGPAEQIILSQQFGPRSFTRNMGAPMMPSYAPPMFNQQGSTAGQTDYLSAVSQDGSFRWSPDRLPLHVYISQGGNTPGYRPEFRKMIADAFNEWCNNSHGLLSWSQVNDPSRADVVATWTNNPTIKPGAVEAGQTRTLVQNNRETGEGRIVTAQISILTQFMGKPFTNENMYKTCLHEVGHALGLQGHSDVASDIMYPTVNPTQATSLKARDVNTLAHLYSVAGYTALNSTGSPEIGSVLPFTGGGGTQGNRRSYHRSNRSSNNQPFGNVGSNMQMGDVQPFAGSGSQQTDNSGITPFVGSNGSQSTNDDGITPFTGTNSQDDSDSSAPFYGRRQMQQAGGNGGAPFFGRGIQQFGGNGMTPSFGRGRMQQSGFGGGFGGGFGRGFGGGQGFNQGQQTSDTDDDGSDADGQQWQGRGQGFGNDQGGPHQHMHGNWARRAAMREFMLRQAQQQNGFYNN